MALSLTTIEMWSESAQSVVTWSIGFENDPSFQTHDNEPAIQIIVARYNDEFHKFSPNSTDDEILRQVKEINKEKI